MASNGLLLEVRWEWDGTELSADAVLGATVLPIQNSDAISVQSQVWVQGSGPYTVNAVDLDADTITLATGLDADYEAGSEVVPDAGGQPGQVWVAEVMLPDADQPIEVPLTIHDLAVMPEGTFEPPRAIVLSDDLQTVVDLPGTLPTVSGTFVPPETLPLPPTSDGDPPPTVSGFDMIGGIGVIHYRWTGVTNNDNVTYDIHISTAPGFTPGPGTLVASTDSTAATVKTDAAGVPLDYGTEDTPTIYYGRVVARDDDGAAAPSVEDSTFLHRVDNVEISSLYAYLGTVLADQIITGTLDAAVTLSGLIQTAVAGRRVVMDALGLHLYSSANKLLVDLPTDPSLAAQFNGDANLTNVTITGSGSFRAKTTIEGSNSPTAFGDLVLGSGVSDPTQPPTISLDHETMIPITGAFPNTGLTAGVPYSYVRGVATDGTYSYILMTVGNSGARVLKVLRSTGVIQSSWDPAPGMGSYFGHGDAAFSYFGIAYDGTYLWVGAQSQPSGAYFHVGKFSTAGVQQGLHYEFNRPNDAVAVGGLAYYSGTLYLGLHTDTSPYAFRLYGFDPATGTVTLNKVLAAGLGSSVPSSLGFAVGVFDFGDSVPRAIFNLNGVAKVYDFAGANLSNRPNDEFEFGQDGLVGGKDPFFWDETAAEFRQIDSYIDVVNPASPSLTRKRFTSINWTTQPSTWWANYVWRDSDAGGTGTHVSGQGEKASFTMKRRYRLTLQSATIPDYGGADDPNAVTFLLNRSGSSPANMYAQGGTLADGIESLTLTTTPTFTGTTGVAGTAFPTVLYPGRLRSVKSDVGGPIINLQGDGIGRVGELSWTTDGKMSSNPTGRLMWGHSSSVANIPNAVATVVTGWATKATSDFSTLPGAGGSPAGTVTIQSNGLYLLNASISWASNGTLSRRQCLIYVNGVEVQRNDIHAAAYTATITQGCSVVIPLVSGDLVDVRVLQNTGAALALGGATPGHDFQIARLL